ncbi:hypothetical protein DYE49_03775 [Treponema rectale]|uniref:PD-(D/E)XK nuclease superfamily protein n=1 Tax=Treponema rectale TaxID=744512 RepID=A0A7M1XJD3_9SPIR|nr:hypothetical protein DYE49_03775 [Treponema rectale]
MSDYQKFKELLTSYVNQKFPKDKKEKITFFDVTGYPHYENVASNVLKFLFDVDEEHGFRDLWLKSLMEVYNQKAKTKISLDSLDVVNIEREYSNGTEKRIDLLIDARPLIVVIENKIYASVNNPFDTYTEMANNYAKDNQITDAKFAKIVLSLSKENLDQNNGFINITYDELFDHVENSWWEYNPKEKWGIFAKDFIANLQKRKGDTHMKMDEKWIHFVNENSETLKNLFDKVQNDIDTRISILRKLDAELNGVDFKKGVYNSKHSTYASLYVDIKLKDGATICFETYLMKSITKKEAEDYDKLYLSLWCREHKNYDFSRVLKAIKKEDARSISTGGKYDWGKHYILDEINMCEEFSIPEIGSKIKQYIDDASKLCS